MVVAELVSKNIKRLRLELGWSQEELAQRSSLSLRVISRLETEPQNITLKTLDAIATALQVNHARLFAGRTITRSRSDVISEIKVLLDELR